MKSQYIPQSKQIVKESMLTRMMNKIPRSFYIGRVKVQFDSYPVVWRFGISIFPQYLQFEFNVGKYVMNIWYRKA